ncbi:MAG: hypothetical protein QOF11_2101 [Chloroflexota bacterium]|nr:hypothetical protein [Chloroflexota bacterium]
MRRPLPTLLAGLFAFAVLASASLVTISPASAAPIAGAPTVYCGDPGTDPSMDTGAGTMITCDISVTNTITAIDSSTGVPTGTSVVRVTECTGPASGRLNPAFLTCSTDLQTLVQLVTSIQQCNGVGYGGGNVLECDVEVTNDFVGVVPQVLSAVTVSQCVPGAAVTTGCNPNPASVTNATITQCNASSYGGGQEDFNCTASGTTTGTLSVTVHQCNDSNYGGGSWLNCSASLTNNIISAPTATPAPTTAPTATPAPTTAPTAGPTTAPTAAPDATSTLAPRPIVTQGLPPTSTAVDTERDGKADPWARAGLTALFVLAFIVTLGYAKPDRRRD